MSEGHSYAVLLDVRDLEVYFRLDEGILKAVDGIAFRVEKKALGLAGGVGL